MGKYVRRLAFLTESSSNMSLIDEILFFLWFLHHNKEFTSADLKNDETYKNDILREVGRLKKMTL